MKKSKEETARTRERILDSAARRFRAGGFDGVSVKDLMGEAGLTHGAFYAHFPSKDALISAACREAFLQTTNRLVPPVDVPPQETLSSYLDGYLSHGHVERPATGCAITSLGPEAARASDEVKQAFSVGIASLIDQLAAVSPGEDPQSCRARAIATLAEAVGTLVLARAVEPGDLRNDILESARRHLLPRPTA